MEYGEIGFTAVRAIIEIVFVSIVFGMGLAGVLTWMERRQSAMIQDRVGPSRASIRLPLFGEVRAWGLVHFVADALKLMSKEDFIPSKAHRFLFALAPILAIAPVLIVAAIIPFGAPLCWGGAREALAQGAVCAQPVPLQVARLDTGVLFYFAFSSLSVFGATLAGWASHNKWAMLGGLRASSQMISYEVTMGMAALGAFLVYGTLEPGAMVARQAGLWDWGIFRQPLGFLLFLTAAVAESKRTPFDLPEGESEIVGYFVEYSGLRFGIFYLGEFLEVVFSSALMVTIFLGGWHLPVAAAETALAASLPNWAFVLVTLVVWMAKVFLFSFFQLLIRWSVPRFRPDQLMQLGWQRLLPASIANVVATALVVLYRQAGK